MARPSDQGTTDALAVQIGLELANARRAAGMSVVELHRATGISRTVIQGYERGRYKPGAGELKKLSEALGCSPNRLLFGREDVRAQSALDKFLGGDPGTTESTLAGARAGMLFAHLARDERRAVMTLITRLIEARIGGDGLASLLAHQEVVERSMRDAAGLGGDLMASLEARREALSTDFEGANPEPKQAKAIKPAKRR